MQTAYRMLVSPIQICVCAPVTLFAKNGLAVISLPFTAVIRQAKIAYTIAQLFQTTRF